MTGVKGNAENTYRAGNVNITAANIGAATTDIATATKAGLMSAELFNKLDNIEAGAQKNSTAIATTTSNGLMSKEDKTLFNQMTQGSVIGVKGNSETEYRTGNVNLTAANVGAAAASHTHSAADITSGTLPVSRGGTGQTSLNNVSVGSANKLSTARTIITNLASTDSVSFDGSKNITPGVTGILPIANGGTGNSKGTVNSFNIVAITSANIDELKTNGFYEIYSPGCTNLPITTSYKRHLLLVYALPNSYGGVLQVFFSFDSNAIYMRVCLGALTAGGFYGWAQVYNDGFRSNNNY